MFAFSLAACAGQTFRLPDNLPGNYVALTRPIILIADTQEHEATGFPLHENDGAVDSYTEVAQRPPEQPLFGRRLYEWAMQSHQDEPVIHLGDVLDISCQSELDRMRKIFEAAKQPGAIVPGNHDGLLFGIFNYDLFTDYVGAGSLIWQRGCLHGAGSGDQTKTDQANAGVNKRKYTATYLAALANGPRSHAGINHPPPSGDFTLSWRNSQGDEFIEGIDANFVDGRNYAQTFLVQKLRLPLLPGAPRRVSLIAIDTNQLDFVMSVFNMLLGKSPGSMGRVLRPQLDAIKVLVEEAQGNGELVLFAGHHSWDSIEPVSKLRLGNIMRRLDHPLVYFSAHEHSGFWQKHGVLGRGLLELNVSSLSDWPLAYRRMVVSYDADAKRLKVAAELQPSYRGEAPKSDADLLRGWTEKSCVEGGVPEEWIAQRDLESVQAQRDARGGLIDWLLEGLEDLCESCRRTLYESAHRYQDGLLQVISQLYNDLAYSVPAIHDLERPAFCDDLNVRNCASSLLATSLENLDLSANVELFRKKALLVDTVNRQLDGLDAPQIKAYMTCRAAIATKDDFDLTPSHRIQTGSEAERRDRGFFHTEATVGMD